MDLEKLKEILGIEGDEQDEKIEAAIAAINEETAGLVSTKDKLRHQVKDLDKRLKSFRDIDLEEIEEMKTELATLREAAEAGDGGDGDTKKISAEERKAIEERATKKLSEQLADLQTKLGTVTSEYHGTLKEQRLKAAMDKINLKPEAKETIYDAFASKAKVEEIDGELNILLTNKDGLDLPPEEYFADWAKSDSAKIFINPPDNTGGGARGGATDNKGGKTITRADFEQLDPAAKQEFVANKGQVTDNQ